VVHICVQLFDLLKEQRGEEVLAKVEAVSADMEAPDLALSASDRQRLAEEVEMIYHCAATIRFDESLRKAVFLNTRGTKLMLDLAKECKKLVVSHFNSFNRSMLLSESDISTKNARN
jgi:fatty acyl-CoA reductase